ncbi:ATP-binding cassette domain-containing protein [Azospirillum sp.]|uniref:ABC transporter ATP-binding protein n=1 Tax=Azospirillum sp. TaxID=34012 RepID=UPI0026304409|nr:ATP-binding cassette domain-containing protein [Azospirillum sp.]
MTGDAAITVDGLRIDAGSQTLVHEVGFTLPSGSVLVMMGETGSGKSLVAQAVMGCLPSGLSASGRIAVAGRRTVEERKGLWGRHLALLPQEPWNALDPTMRVGKQVALAPVLLGRSGWRAALRQAGGLLDRLGLAGAERRYPFQLSGGMAQRVAFAAATITGPAALIADEPTKGLDADRRDAIAAQLLGAAGQGAAVMVITHDVALARRLGGRMMVMLRGEVVEEGETAVLLDAPTHAYTRRLMAADPARWRPAAVNGQTAAPPVLEAEGVALTRGGRTLFSGVDLALSPGRVVAVSGPSGCGKTSLGNLLLGLLPPGAGRVRRSDSNLLRYQKLHQDPIAAFAPSVSLRTGLTDLCRRHRLNWAAARELLERMGLDEALLDRRPAAVSGGELQRVALARALLLDPCFLFADEATSRLDPLTQADVMGLLRGLVRDQGLAMLMVTHDPALAAGMADHRLALAPPGTRQRL